MNSKKKDYKYILNILLYLRRFFIYWSLKCNIPNSCDNAKINY